ncbi:hypothetical protein IFM89_008443 [Coptis chinensis]|uniref:Uncharacterized protein n=1 Tax=Coptis chinensis TaxID=261450 RepID=A0A835M7H1_9MAGN|nr:hypothetical protein IFM89_008443 [Coptis chinensis]
MMDIGEVVKKHRISGGGESAAVAETSVPSSDFVLQWGNRKRLRCMKIQVKNESTTDQTRVRINRGVVKPVKESISNFRRPNSPPLPPPAHRISRNSETMKSHQCNGVISPEGAEEKKGNKDNTMSNNNNNNNGVGGASGSSETAAQDSKKGGSSSGSEAIPVWLPKFVLALTNKEKEEDFMAIKGSKLPQRPKKRAKFVQRTLNLVSPGAWLCDLTLERYEVREKKISKKRPRGLKAMGNMDSDSD